MKYISTRGNSPKVDSAYAIKKGLAPDGGLYVPENIPSLTENDITDLCKMDYAQRAATVLSMFLPDYDKDLLYTDCQKQYAESNFFPAPAPIKELDDHNFVLELWHGPTCAFKDMALQIMPRLLSRAIDMTNEKQKALILVATSGDTGKAALEGYKDLDNIDIMVFYPRNGVSRMQQLQMATQEGGNLAVYSINGNFDDAQNAVKKTFADSEFSAQLAQNGYILSSANSINWGRLAPQIVYYISAYCDLLNANKIKYPEEINICVPTGNFGNILAAYVAKLMGMPFKKLICASNKNKVLTDFLSTGVYDRNRDFYTTVSPSMDILISSNLERLLYFTLGAEQTSEYMKQLSECGKYEISPEALAAIRANFEGFFCDDSTCLERIAKTFDEYGYLIDTHTAVALESTFRYNTPVTEKCVTVSTASPYKFAPAVLDALGCENEALDDFARLDALYSKSGAEIPEALAAVKNKPVRFDAVIDPSDMKDVILSFINM